MRYLLFISLLALCVSCDYFRSKQQNDPVLAEAEGKTLRLSEVKNIFFAGITPEDSLELLKNHIYNWTSRCVLAAKAEQELDKQQLSVAKELDDYRMSLLAYRYEMFRLQRDLDTLVSNDELLRYHEQNSSGHSASFSPRVKAVYVRVRHNAEKLNELRSALTENKDRQFLDSLLMAMSVQPDYFGNRWIVVEEIPGLLPFTQEDCNFAIRNNLSVIEEKRGEIVHLFGIREVSRRPDYPPVSQLREQYYNTIINQRRMELLKKIEKEVYNDALDNQRLKIYVNE